MKDEVVVMGKLTADGISKCAFGGAMVTRHKETGHPVSLADDLKAAATDALKKACSLLGIGLHLHDERDSAGKGRNGPKSSSCVSKKTMAKSGPKSDSAPRITEKQLAAIFSIGRRLGIAEDNIRVRAKECYGTDIESLSRVDAGVFISVLSEELNKRKGAA